MPGTVIMPPEVVTETLIYTMLGLWDDGYRKIILVNNHGHRWMLESAVQEFFKRYQLPAIVMEVEWHRAVREFFTPEATHANSMETPFIHADEAETAVAQLLFPDMIDMDAKRHGRTASSLPVTTITPSMPTADPTSGARVRAIRPSSARAPRRASSVTPVWPRRKRQSARSPRF